MLKKLRNVNAEKYRHNKGSKILDLEKDVWSFVLPGGDMEKSIKKG